MTESPPPERPADDTAALVAYIRVNRERYSPDALRKQLIAAGHPADRVDAALAEAQLADRFIESRGPALDAPRTWSATFGSSGFWVAFLAVVLGAVGIGLLWMAINNGSLIGILILVLLLGTFVVMITDRFGADVQRGAGCALAALVGTPFIVFGAILAYCLVNPPTF